jgi:type II secretory pathway pseudopilin PulG
MKIGVCKWVQRNQAWSLAEVMVAVMILALVLVSVFAGFGLGFGIIKSTREDLRATQILTQKIEGIRLCTWSQLTTQCPTSFTETYAIVGGGSNNDLPAAYRDKVKLITVTVTWTTSKAGLYQSTVTHTRSMQTESAFYGLQNYLYGLTNSI